MRTKTLHLVALLCLFFTIHTKAQTTYQGDLVLTTQAAVDAFPSTYTSITGNLRILNSNITNLAPLSNIELVGGSLQIDNADGLTHLDDLIGLTSVKFGLTLDGNANLINIDGLSNMSFSIPNPNIIIKSNDALNNLNGLSGLTGEVQNLILQSNDNLMDITGLSGVTKVRFRMTIQLKNLPSLDGLENITHVGDDFKLWFCDFITTSYQLSGITYFGGTIEVRFNSRLEDIGCLGGLITALDDVDISFNGKMDDFSAMSNLISTNRELYIRDNAMVTMAGFENLTSVGTTFSLFVNRKLENLDGLENLETIGGGFTLSNFNMINVDGLSSLTSIGGNFRLYHFGSSDLVDVSGLSNLASIGGFFQLTGNNLLDECCIFLPILTAPGAIGGNINISGNSTNCTSQLAIESWCTDLDGDGITGMDGDCDNDNNTVYPGAPELCDGLDNNCNELVDEDVQITCYQDLDGDSYGNPDSTIMACACTGIYVEDNTDCDDGNELSYKI